MEKILNEKGTGLCAQNSNDIASCNSLQFLYCMNIRNFCLETLYPLKRLSVNIVCFLKWFMIFLADIAF